MNIVTLTDLINDAKCYELIRQHRWPEGVCCPRCGSMDTIKNGKDDTQPDRQRYVCKNCRYHFDDLSDSVFATRHQPLRVWVGCLYLMGLNLSNSQIAYELALYPYMFLFLLLLLMELLILLVLLMALLILLLLVS